MEEVVLLSPSERRAITEKIDENADGNTYFGSAVSGTATSATGWRIQRKSVSGTETTFAFADGDIKFDNVWDDRTTLTYS